MNDVPNRFLITIATLALILGGCGSERWSDVDKGNVRGICKRVAPEFGATSPHTFCECVTRSVVRSADRDRFRRQGAAYLREDFDDLAIRPCA